MYMKPLITALRELVTRARNDEARQPTEKYKKVKATAYPQSNHPTQDTQSIQKQVEVENVLPQTPLGKGKPRSIASQRGLDKELERSIPVMTSSPLPKSTLSVATASSPPPSVSRDGGPGGGEVISRRKLAEIMGVDYYDKVRKIQLRGKVKDYVLRYIDMSKPYSAYNYSDVMYPIIRGCTKYMNNDILPGNTTWTKGTTQFVIKAIFEDARRNKGSKEKSAAKRKEKRELEVSPTCMRNSPRPQSLWD
jgi:hypothetical protein